MYNASYVYLSKNFFISSERKTFYKFIKNRTDANYKQTHSYVENISDITDTPNPLNFTSNIIHDTVHPKNIGMILVFASNTDISPETIKKRFADIYLMDSAPDNSGEKLIDYSQMLEQIKLWSQIIIGWCYIIHDADRDILCIYEFFINTDSVFVKDDISITFPLATGSHGLLNKPIRDVNTSDTRENSFMSDVTKDEIVFDEISEHKRIKALKIILESVLIYSLSIRFNTTLWFGIDINDGLLPGWTDILTDIFTNNGFGNAYLATKDPMNVDTDYIFVGLTKMNNSLPPTQDHIDLENNKILYIYNQNLTYCLDKNKFPTCYCKLEFKFEKRLIEWLSRLPFSTYTPDPELGEGWLSQKEFAGAFRTNKLIRDSVVTERFIWEFVLDETILTTSGQRLQKIKNNITQLDRTYANFKNALLYLDTSIPDSQNKLRQLKLLLGDGMTEIERLTKDVLYKNTASEHNSIIEGQRESVNLVEGVINFHVHPCEAYQIRECKLGFPSSADMITLLSNRGILANCVVTIEGLYIISINKTFIELGLDKQYMDIGNEIRQSIENAMNDEYQYKHSDIETPEEFCELVNHRPYNDIESLKNSLRINTEIAPAIFNIQFKTWDKLLSDDADIFKINYRLNGSQCVIDYDTSFLADKLYTYNRHNFFEYNPLNKRIIYNLDRFQPTGFKTPPTRPRGVSFETPDSVNMESPIQNIGDMSVDSPERNRGGVSESKGI